MSANNSTPLPTSGSRLDEKDQDSDDGIDLGFDWAEGELRYSHRGMRPDQDLRDAIARDDRR